MNRQAPWELLAALTSLRDKKAIILTGDGDSFCSGVTSRRSGPMPNPEYRPTRNSTGSRFALGGGAKLIGVCDPAIAAHEAEIGMPEIGFGAYPQFSGLGAQIQIAAKRAAWLALTAERIDGRTAEAWGLCRFTIS